MPPPAAIPARLKCLRKLSSLLHELSTKLYEQVRRNNSPALEAVRGQESSSSGGGNQEDVVDADYEVVDGDEQK